MFMRYHCAVANPVEPLAWFKLAVDGPDQSQGQAALHAAVEGYTNKLFLTSGPVSFVVLTYHETSSEMISEGRCVECHHLPDEPTDPQPQPAQLIEFGAPATAANQADQEDA